MFELRDAFAAIALHLAKPIDCEWHDCRSLLALKLSIHLLYALSRRGMDSALAFSTLRHSALGHANFQDSLQHDHRSLATELFRARHDYAIHLNRQNQFQVVLLSAASLYPQFQKRVAPYQQRLISPAVDCSKPFRKRAPWVLVGGWEPSPLTQFLLLPTMSCCA